MSLTFEYPTWYMIMCAALAGLYTFLLYVPNHSTAQFKKVLHVSLSLFRFVVVFILGLLLMNPLLNQLQKEIEKPVLVVAQDISSSVLIGEDTSKFPADWKANLASFIQPLQEKFDVKQIAFSGEANEGVDLRFNGLESNISSAIEWVDDNYYKSNLGGVVLLSDGINNKGINPLYYKRKEPVPIYTVGMGDTTVQRDALLADGQANAFAYLGNKFQIKVKVKSAKLRGKSASLSLYHNGKQVGDSRSIEFTEDNFWKWEDWIADAVSPGTQRYTFKLSVIEGEVSTVNNTLDIYVEVIDNRQKILLLSSAPHPDIAAIKTVLKTVENYKIETALTSKFDGNLKPYSLIIAHNVSNAERNLFQKLQDSSVPVWHILSRNLSRNLTIPGLTYRVNNGQTEQYYGQVNERFTAFTFNKEELSLLMKFAPVEAPFAKFKFDNQWDAILYQRIGSVVTETPLFAFRKGKKDKNSAILIGEGLWRLRLKEFDQKGNQDTFDSFIKKVVTYLSVKTDKRKFRVSSPKTLLENEEVKFEAQLFNDAYELVNEPEVKLLVKHEDGDEFNYVFSPYNESYRLNAGGMRVGKYTFEAETNYGKKAYKQSGEFTIKTLSIENWDRVANHQLLKQLSAQTGGKFYEKDKLALLAEVLLKENQMKPLQYTKESYSELIHKKWVFFLLILLFTMEWFLRKRNGAY